MRLANFLTLILLLAVASVAVSDDQPRTIQVVGQGIVSVPPDMAQVHAGVVTQHSEAKEALYDNSAAVSNLFAILKQQGIASRDLQTTSFHVQPEFERLPRGGGGRTPRIAGYRVTNQLRVRVRKMDSLGEILDAMVRAGSNNVSGISFSIDKRSKFQDQARKLAIDDARRRAQVYADRAGVRLGKTRSISEQLNQVIRPQPMARMAMDESVPVAMGEQDIQAAVSVVYEIVDKD